MNASPLARVSSSALSGIAGVTGTASSWFAGHFARAPLATTGVILIGLGYVLATGNALYGQSGNHPAPLFGSDTWEAPAPIAPVEAVPAADATRAAPAATSQPVATPTPAVQPAVTETAAAPTPAPVIGNADIAQMQEKLSAMGLFSGTIDGFYGPQTADAIRAFEDRMGLPRTGAVSPELLQAVAAAPIPEAQVATPAPTPAAQPAVAAAAPAGDIGTLIADAPAEPGVAELVAPRELTGGEVALAALPIPTGPAEDGPVAEPGMFESLFALASPTAPAEPRQPMLDTQLVTNVQRGLSQLGFLRAPVTGVADNQTALAIRNFEIFHNFEPSGTVSYALLDRLVAAGATP